MKMMMIVGLEAHLDALSISSINLLLSIIASIFGDNKFMAHNIEFYIN